MYRALSSLLKSHKIRLLSMALIFWVVILIITLIQQIIINVNTQINNETKPIVGADLTIENTVPFEQEVLLDLNNIISGNGWSSLQTTEFYTTLESNTSPKLVQVKWIEPWYPWYGDLTIKNKEDTDTRTSIAQPLQDGVWIDQQTYNLISNKDTLVLWNSTLPIQWIIIEQNSIWFNFLDEGRTILLPYAVVEKTKLTDFGSRVSYKIQVKTNNDVQAVLIQDAITNKYGETYKVSLARDRVEQLGGIINQLNQYTSTLLIVTLLLSLMVMATATMTMTIKITTSIAIMRIVGLTRLQTLWVTSLLFWSFFIIGACIGIWGAYLVFQNISMLVPLAQDFLRYPGQIITIIALSVVSFVIACRQSLTHLTTTHPLALLKQDSSWAHFSPLISGSVIWWGSWIILSLLNNNILFSLWIIVWSWWVLRGGYLLLRKLFWLLHEVFKKFRTSSFTWFDASRQTIIPWNQTGLLVGGLSSALLAFCIIIAMSLSFMERLDTSAIDQPNLFVLNVRNEDITTIKKIDPKAKLYDTILWRISSINGITLREYLTQKNQESEEFTREFNITSQVLDNSPIIQGKALQAWGVSFDQDFAKRLWVTIGDKINLFIQWRSFDLTITSLRKSISTWAEPFFFLQLDQQEFEQAPRSRFWVTKQEEWKFTSFKQEALDSVWPHLSFIDISAIILLVSDISNKIIAIILTCMSIIIVLILLVSIASNEASALVSQRTYRLYHIIGMTKWQLSQISWRIGIIYAGAIILIIMLIVPAVLWYIYTQASLLTRSSYNLLPIIGGVGITTSVMIISYRLFHSIIIKKL